MPSAVFISVSFLPFSRVTVGAPVEREPPAIPILAVVGESETSVKYGCAFGNVAPTLTSSETPFTEIVAVVAVEVAGG